MKENKTDYSSDKYKRQHSRSVKSGVNSDVIKRVSPLRKLRQLNYQFNIPQLNLREA